MVTCALVANNAVRIHCEIPVFYLVAETRGLANWWKLLFWTDLAPRNVVETFVALVETFFVGPTSPREMWWKHLWPSDLVETFLLDRPRPEMWWKHLWPSGMWWKHFCVGPTPEKCGGNIFMLDRPRGEMFAIDCQRFVAPSL